MAAPDVAEELGERIPVSLSLALAGLVVAILIGIPLGILAGSPRRRGRPCERHGTSFGVAIPNFWLGFFLARCSPSSRVVPGQGNQVRRRSQRGWRRHPPRICPRRLGGRVARPATRAALIESSSRTTYGPRAPGRGHARMVVKHGIKKRRSRPSPCSASNSPRCSAASSSSSRSSSIPGLGTYLLGRCRCPTSRDPGGHGRLRPDLRDAQPDRRHQLRLPQPDCEDVVGSEIFGQGPLAGDIEPSPQLVEDGGDCARRGDGRHATPSPWKRAFKRLLRDKPAVIALAFLLLIILMAVFRRSSLPTTPTPSARRSRRRASTIRSAPITTGATPSAGSSTAARCRCAPASRSWAWRR